MNVQEAFKELARPEQRQKHLHVFTHQVGVLILDVVVFYFVLFIGSLILRLEWNIMSFIIGGIGAFLLWVWLMTGGKVDDGK